MTAQTIDLVESLLAAGLRAWRVGGEVHRAADGAVVVSTRNASLRVTRAVENLPFRWMVTTGERTRGVASIAGLLRSVRAAVDPDHRPNRLRIAPQPVVPS